MKKLGGGKPAEAVAKKAGGAKDFFTEYKRQLIFTAITAIVCGLIFFVAKTASGVFTDMRDQSAKAVTDVINKTENLKASDRYFTKDEEKLNYNQTKIEWVGNKIDTGRWMSDEGIFWDFIAPAFNFKTATDYNKMREDYIEKVGNCLFTVQFLSYYDIEGQCRRDENGNVNQVDFERINNAYSCTSDKSRLRTFPMSVDNNGDYTYLALVPMKNNYVAFTYKIVHEPGQGGKERITLADFDCWPPNSKAPFGVDIFGQ